MGIYESQAAWNEHQEKPTNPETGGEVKQKKDRPFLSVTLVDGFLIHDPLITTTKSGKTVGKFVLGIGNGYPAGSISFLEVETWDKRAKACHEYLRKGNRVIVQGKLKQDRWENENGEKRSRIKLVADNVIFLTPFRREKADS